MYVKPLNTRFGAKGLGEVLLVGTGIGVVVVVVVVLVDVLVEIGTDKILNENPE